MAKVDMELKKVIIDFINKKLYIIVNLGFHRITRETNRNYSKTSLGGYPNRKSKKI